MSEDPSDKLKHAEGLAGPFTKNYVFAAYFSLKEFLKSVNIWQKCGRKYT